MALGGMAAEELVFSDTTAGVVADLESATRIARKMITQFGMSPLGPVAYVTERENFLGSLASENQYSEQTAEQIDVQVRQVIGECYQEVKQTLSEQRTVMDAIVLELLKRETLGEQEVKEIAERVRESSYDFGTAQAEVAQIREKLNALDAVPTEVGGEAA